MPHFELFCTEPEEAVSERDDIQKTPGREAEEEKGELEHEFVVPQRWSRRGSCYQNSKTPRRRGF
jgi:hypothetical protein